MFIQAYNSVTYVSIPHIDSQKMGYIANTVRISINKMPTPVFEFTLIIVITKQNIFIAYTESFLFRVD
jgi:hypothetical protein